MSDDGAAPVPAAPLAPARVALPAALPAPAIPPDTPPDMAPIASRFAAFSVKPYRAGILNKANVQAPDGRLFPRHDWTPWYVEHIGPLLMFWPAPSSADPDVISALQSRNRAQIHQHCRRPTGSLSSTRRAFALNTAGCNLYHLQAADNDDLAQWIASIRLACFEFAKLHEQYTAALLVRPPFRAPAALALIGSDKFAAAVQVRYSGCAEWRKLWCVVYPADQPPPPPQSSRTSILKRKSLALSASSSLASLAEPGPQIILYDSKKLKRAVLTLTNIYQAYAVYPERPHLINLSMLGKLEGTVTDHDPNPNSPITHPAFCLVMTSAPDDLAAFLVATCAAFRLYDVAPARSMGGVPVPPNLRVAPTADETSLFLTSEDTQGLDLAANHLQAKALLERTLAAKLAGANAPPKTPPEVPPTPRSAGGKSRAEKVASVAVAAGGAAAAMAGKAGGKGKGKQLPPPPASSDDESGSRSDSASESGSETGSNVETGSEEASGSEEETGSESESGSEDESEVEHTTTDDHGVTTGTDHSGSEAETTDSEEEEESDAESDVSDAAHVKPRKYKTKDLDSVTRGVGKIRESDEHSGSDDEHTGSDSESGSGSGSDDDDATTTSGSDVTDSDDHDTTSSEESTDSDASDSESDVSDGPITNGASRGGPMPQFDPNAVDFMAGLNANRYAASVATSDSGKPPVPEFAPNSLLSNPHAAGTNKSGPGADEPLVPAFVQFGGLLAKPKATLLQQHQEVQKRQQYYAQLQEHHQQQQLEQAVQREQQYSVMARPRGPLLSVAPRQDAAANAAGLLSVVSSREKTRQQQKYAYSGFASGSGVAELVERGAGTGKQIALDFERDRDRQMALESRQLAKEMAEERQRLEEMMAVQRLQQQQAQLQQQQQQQQQQAQQQAAQAQQQQMGMWGASPASASPHTMSMYGAPAGMGAMGAMGGMGGMGMMQGGMQGMQGGMQGMPGMAAMNRGMATPSMPAMNPYAGMMGHPAGMMGPSVPPQAAVTALSSDSDASSGSDDDDDDDSDASATGSEGTGSDSDATGSESGTGSETGTDDEDASGSGSGSGTESEEEESEEEKAPAPVVVTKGKGKAKSKDRSLPSPTAATTPMGMMAAPGYYPMAGGFNPALYQQQMQQMQQMQMMQQMYAGMAGMAGAQGGAPGQPQQAGAWPGMPYGMMPMMPMMPMMQAAPAQQPAAVAKGKSKGKKSKK
ncbi:hypothetical protein AMAG_10024 [Allomyces macrogynus ATCC 38327]|uniref:Skg3/CAF120-like PH-like domain-containing protein n=1 Tax=Allomyces macrogynus (strain ATCC 38327) TaxID=578462 RepID=A0A0L0SQP1_ALLM3|nr:hypothetical protein AMAG_10024 [Allomyces macrogynus ATCC 38327]|eukprot:KNE64670.1 hypothetical protein AMAG_10024 [Allomyces macrogynus ATCC 38327]